MTSGRDAIRILFSHLDPNRDPQVRLRADALRRFSFMWLLLDQLPGGGWGKSTSLWMEENWTGSSMQLDMMMEQEGGFESSLFCFDIYCRVCEAAGHDPLYETRAFRRFREYIESRWDKASNAFGTVSLRQEGALLFTTLRQTALGNYGLLLLNEHMSGHYRRWLTNALRSLFTRAAEEYKEPRNAGLAYLLMTYLARELTADEGDRRFTKYPVPVSVREAIQHWRKEHEEGMKEAFLKDRYRPIPQRTRSRKEAAHPFIVPYGEFYRMTAYTHLAATRFVTKDSDADVRKRLADGIESLCRSYKRRTANHRYHEKDRLKPTVRGIEPWNRAGFGDLGVTAQMLAILTDPATVCTLWGDTGPPKRVRELVPLLHEDLVEQFDRHLIEPSLLRYTPAMTLAHVLLVPWDWEGTGLDAIEESVEDICDEHGVSEWSLNRMVEELIFRREEKLPTHLFARSLGRILLERVRPGRYPEGPLEFNGDQDKADLVIDATVEKYQDRAFAQKFDLVHGSSPHTALVEMFLDELDGGAGKTVLDVGSGPGQYAKLFQGAGMDVTLLDVSPAMLRIACRRLGWQENDPRAIEGDARDIQGILNRTKFDAIWCCSTLIHFPSPVAEQILRSFARHLKPDGVLMVNCAVGNPRLVAEDKRFYSYWDDRRDFVRLLEACGFQVDKSISTEVSRNVYGEPRLAIRWDSFYCTKPGAGIEEDERHVARARDMTATAYGLIVRRFFAEHGDGANDEIVDEFLELLPPRSRILDAGCGPGHYSAKFWERGHEGVGLDLCNEMISLARQQHRNQIKEPDRTYVVGDMCELDGTFEDGSFDAVFCMAAFQHVPVAKGMALSTLRGFLRVLNPGGVLLLDVQYGRTTGFEPDGRFTQGYKDVKEAEELLREAGFVDVRSGHPIDLEAGNNAFKRDIELHFCNITARKPGKLPERPVPDEMDETEYAVDADLHFTGLERGKNTFVAMNGQRVSLAPGYFNNLLHLAVAAVTGKPGVHAEDLESTNPHQEIGRLRKKFGTCVDGSPKALIQFQGDGTARLCIPPARITFDLEKLARHSSGVVQDRAAQLRDAGVPSTKL